MQTDLDDIIRLGETETAEFKKSLSLQKEALAALCRMINSDNAEGMVLFGVSPDGSIAGVEEGNLDSAQKSLVQHIRDKVEPPIVCSVEVLQCEGKTLLLLKANRAPGVPYHEYDGRAYIREGSTRRQLSYDEKRQLSKKRDRDRHSGPWRCNRCGAVAGMLLGFVVTDQGVRKTYTCDCGGEYWPMY
jgi:predicted HTH transcriptional regulator